jgi:hypothetical protein
LIEASSTRQIEMSGRNRWILSVAINPRRAWELQV